MYIDNNWYGNRFILSRYCKIKDKSALACIQHGLFLPKNFLKNNQKIKRTFNFPWLVWDKKTEKVLKKRDVKNIFSIGSPFIYLNDILKNKIFSKPKGTLIIPTKSSKEVNLTVDYLSIINFLKKKFPKPYTIVVGYFDLKEVGKIKNKFKDCKFVTCGKRGNKFFSFKLFKMMKMHKKVVILYAGSPILYSLFLKKKNILLP